MTRLTTLTVAIAGLLALASPQTAQAGDREHARFGIRIGSHDGRGGLSVSYHRSDHDRHGSKRYHSSHRSAYRSSHHPKSRYSTHHPNYHSNHYTKYSHRSHPVYTRNRSVYTRSYPVVVRHQPVVSCPPPVVVHERPVVVHKRPVVYHHEPDYLNMNGWQALADGRGELAWHIFRAKGEANPRVGGPMIGAGIAHLMLGDDRSAALAFHRAVQVDPGAFDRIPNHPGLFHKLARHAQRLEHRGHSRYGTFNDLVSAAALYLIIDDYVRAEALIEKAIARGDYRASTHAFKQLLGPIHQPHHGQHKKHKKHHGYDD